MKLTGLAALGALTMLTACGGGDPAATVEAVRQTEQSQLAAIESDDLVGIARLYADDAVLVKPDGTRLEGGAAIAHEYAALVEDPNFALTIEPLSGWAAGSDDLAVLTSNVSFTTTDAATGEATTLPLESQTVWRRLAGGTWMIVSAYNVAVAPAGEAEPVEDAPQE